MPLKTSKRFAIAAALLAGLGLAPGHAADTQPEDSSAQPQDSAAEVRRETAELLEALKSYSAEQRDEALAKSRAALEQIDRRIEALETRMLEQWGEMDEAARAKMRESLQALREQRTRVAERYGSLKSGSATAWGHIKQGFSDAYRALHDAWEKSEQEFDKEK